MSKRELTGGFIPPVHKPETTRVRKLLVQQSVEDFISSPKMKLKILIWSIFDGKQLSQEGTREHIEKYVDSIENSPFDYQYILKLTVGLQQIDKVLFIENIQPYKPQKAVTSKRAEAIA